MLDDFDVHCFDFNMKALKDLSQFLRFLRVFELILILLVLFLQLKDCQNGDSK